MPVILVCSALVSFASILGAMGKAQGCKCQCAAPDGCEKPHGHEPFKCGNRVARAGGICGVCRGQAPGRRPALLSQPAMASNIEPRDTTAELEIVQLCEEEACGVDVLLETDHGFGLPHEIHEIDFLQPSKKQRKARTLLDFTQDKFLILGQRLQGSVRDWATRVAEVLRVKECRLELFYAWMYFLGETLVRQTGVWEVNSDIIRWWRGGSEHMSDQEIVYMETCQPAMDSSQRRRGPKLCALYTEMQTWCDLQLPEQRLRLLVVWIHFVQIGYFMGRVEFLHEVLLDPADVERSRVKAAVVAYLDGSSETYVPQLLDRLKFYALTRTSLSHYFNSSDGQRMCWHKAEECPKYASCSRCFDSLIHVHTLETDWNWFSCARHTAEAMRSLWRAVSSGEPCDELTRALMFSFLRFPLMGRPRLARDDRRDFAADIHCYWAKFPFNVCLQLLLRELPSQRDATECLLAQYSFIGPAPRYLLATLKGDVGDKLLYKSTLEALQKLQSLVQQAFGVSHAMYSLQINPCDLCHFVTLMRPDKPDRVVEPAGFARAGSISSSRLSLLNSALIESKLIKANLQIFAPLSRVGMQHFSERWFTYDVFQRAWLARFMEVTFSSDLKKAKDVIRMIGGKHLSWELAPEGFKLGFSRPTP